MGPDIRHLVISLVGVFIALIIGILVGVGLVREPQLEKLSQRTEQQFTRLQKQIEKDRQEMLDVRQTNQTLNGNLERQQRVISALAPAAVAHRLDGQRVAIVRTSPDIEFSYRDSLTAMIVEAGGTVIGTLSITPAMLDLDTNARLQLAKQLGAGDVGPDQALMKISRQLAKLVASGQDGKILSDLANQQIIDVTGELQPAPTAILIVGGTKEADTSLTEKIDSPMVDVWRERQLRMVFCESTNVPTSYVAAYQKERISTVDDADTAEGQVAVVLLLAGRNGHFGIKDGAEAVLPSLKNGTGSQ